MPKFYSYLLKKWSHQPNHPSRVDYLAQVWLSEDLSTSTSISYDSFISLN
ncbi:hypothetical protein [Winogradskyella rapida]|uniref:Uncharacterized protein n=1 Tax=Winogradskyella rapida TaxID=549701 RepID=A0ABW3KP73_9FLAO